MTRFHPPGGPPDWAGYLRFRDRFARALDPRRHRIEWLDAMLLGGRFRLIAGAEAAIVVGLEHYPTGACDVHGQIAAGDLQEIAGRLIPEAERWAMSIGCTGAIVSSRPGWAKRLKGQGYETYQVAVRKEF